MSIVTTERPLPSDYVLLYELLSKACSLAFHCRQGVLFRKTWYHCPLYSVTCYVQWLGTRGRTQERFLHMQGAHTCKQVAITFRGIRLALCLTITTTVSNILSPTLTWRPTGLLERYQEALLSCKVMSWHVQKQPWCRCSQVGPSHGLSCLSRLSSWQKMTKDAQPSPSSNSREQAWCFRMTTWLHSSQIGIIRHYV